MKIRQRSIRPLVVGGAVGVLAAVGFLSGAFGTWSNLASDRFFLQRASHESIVVVAIDDASLTQIGRWPWPRSVHADLISKLHAADVAAVGYDVNFPEPSDDANDRALERAIRDAGMVVLPVELTLQHAKDAIVFDPATVVAPIPRFGSAARFTGHANTPPDSDGVVRRVPLTATAPDGGEVPAFALQVLRLTHPAHDLRTAPLDHLSRILINYNGPPKIGFPTIPAIDVIRGTVDPERLRGRVVFVGSTAPDLHDDRLVPTSNGAPMPGVEIHASLYDTLLTKRWLAPLPRIIVAAILVALGIIVALGVSFIRARISIPLTFLLWMGTVVAAGLLFDRGRIVDVLWPSLVIFVSYAAATLERRVTSDRERRELKTAFSRYVSSDVVNAILQDPSKLKLGGEKRRMTVLFSDMRGFTSFSETLPPEKLVEVMNIYLTRMTEIVFEHGGTLDKYIGDAVMAFWNAPLDQPDHARRAVETAMAMQKAVAELNAAHAFPKGVTVKIGVGVNTGEMVVGNMGSETRFDYTVIGDNVNLASRIEGLTKEHDVGILITEATKQEIGSEVKTKLVGSSTVKGRKEAVVLYTVVE